MPNFGEKVFSDIVKDDANYVPSDKRGTLVRRFVYELPLTREELVALKSSRQAGVDSAQDDIDAFDAQNQ